MSRDGLPGELGPMQQAQANMRPPLPKRFYKAAAAVPAGGGFAIHLDGRSAKTPGRSVLAVADHRVAEALAGEWNAQGVFIEPATMPLTRLVNTAIDGVAPNMEAVRAEIVRYAGTDLLCYRAETPQGLVEQQEAAWSPILAWAREALGARFILVAGIRYAEQPPETIARIGAAVAAYESLPLAGLHVATTLSGSAVLALALAHGRLTPEEAWRLAHVDEDWQVSQWGEDYEATARRARRFTEFAAAALALGR